MKFTRSRSGNKNDGAHVEQKNWTTVRQLVGYLRYDTPGELVLLNKIWVLQSLIGNHFYPQQKLISKVRDGAKITKKYDRARPPTPAAWPTPTVKPLRRRRLTAQHASFNPAAVQRQIQALTADLLTLATAKGQPTPKPAVTGPTTGPFHVRQRSAAPGPLDVRQRAPRRDPTENCPLMALRASRRNARVAEPGMPRGELPISFRAEVTMRYARSFKSADKRTKSRNLDEVVSVTGWSQRPVSVDQRSAHKLSDVQPVAWLERRRRGTDLALPSC